MAPTHRHLSRTEGDNRIILTLRQDMTERMRAEASGGPGAGRACGHLSSITSALYASVVCWETITNRFW